MYVLALCEPIFPLPITRYSPVDYSKLRALSRRSQRIHVTVKRANSTKDAQDAVYATVYVNACPSPTVCDKQTVLQPHSINTTSSRTSQRKTCQREEPSKRFSLWNERRLRWGRGNTGKVRFLVLWFLLTGLDRAIINKGQINSILNSFSICYLPFEDKLQRGSKAPFARMLAISYVYGVHDVWLYV
jgi:hypothetical protein